MSKSLWLTPEQLIQKKKQRKAITYIMIFLGTIVLSALLTFLSNQV